MKKIIVAEFVACFLLCWLGQNEELRGVCMQSNPEMSNATQEVKRIESGLSPAVQLKGDAPVQWTLEDRMEHYRVPGVSIAVVKDGEIRWAKGYGIANKETETMVGVDTLFQAGSISKPIAAIAALQLVGEGKVELDKDVNSYLKKWKVPENEFTKDEKVTLRRLLSHSAGMNVHGFPGYKQTQKIPTTAQVLDGVGNTGPIRVDAVPGQAWRYSGGGYTVMQKLVEDVSGMQFDEYLRKHVLDSLGMKQSSFEQPLPLEQHTTASAAYNRAGKIIDGHWNNYPELAAAGLWTTPSDLALYCIELQRIVGGKESGILSNELVKQMLTKHQGNWGLGPGLEGEGDELVFKHGGKNAGFTNDMFAYANRGDAVIVMTNGDNGMPLINEIMRAIADEYDWKGKTSKVELAEMTQEQLQRFAGKYEVEINGRSINIQIDVEETALQVTIPSQRSTKTLNPVGKLRFLDISDGTQIEFSENENGAIETLTINGKVTLTKSD